YGMQIDRQQPGCRLAAEYLRSPHKNAAPASAGGFLNENPSRRVESDACGNSNSGEGVERIGPGLGAVAVADKIRLPENDVRRRAGRRTCPKDVRVETKHTVVSRIRDPEVTCRIQSSPALQGSNSASRACHAEGQG